MVYMIRWKNDARVFTMTVNDLKSGSGRENRTCVISKPILETLDNLDTIMFLFFWVLNHHYGRKY